MNKKIIILLAVGVGVLFSGCAIRLPSVSDEQYEVDELCREYTKANYRVLPGMPVLREQVEKFVRWKRDTSCLLIPVSVRGRSYNAAKIQAENQAKIELSGRLEARVASLSRVNTRVTNAEGTGGKIENQTHVESKVVSVSDLQDLVYVMEVFRVLKGGEMEIVLVVGYKR